MRCYLFLLLIASGVIEAQTVGTAFRTISVSPEEIVVELVLSTPTDTLLEQSVAMLAPLRVGSGDLKSVGTLRENTEKLGWQFSFVRPYNSLNDLVKQLEQARRTLREREIPMSFQFFLRASPKTVEAMKRRVLSELVAEAKRGAGGTGKLRSVVIEPTPENIDAGRPSLLFGQPSGALQYSFSVIAVFDNE